MSVAVAPYGQRSSADSPANSLLCITLHLHLRATDVVFLLGLSAVFIMLLQLNLGILLRFSLHSSTTPISRITLR